MGLHLLTIFDRSCPLPFWSISPITSLSPISPSPELKYVTNTVLHSIYFRDLSFLHLGHSEIHSTPYTTLILTTPSSVPKIDSLRDLSSDIPTSWYRHDSFGFPSYLKIRETHDLFTSWLKFFQILLKVYINFRRSYHIIITESIYLLNKVEKE